MCPTVTLIDRQNRIESPKRSPKNVMKISMITVESQLTGNDGIYNKQYWDNQITIWRKIKLEHTSHNTQEKITNQIQMRKTNTV